MKIDLSTYTLKWYRIEGNFQFRLIRPASQWLDHDCFQAQQSIFFFATHPDYVSDELSFHVQQTIIAHLPLQTMGPMRYGGKLLHICMPESTGFEQI